jgi:hypothetical protein
MMDMDGMGSMMGWMMGLGLIAWVLIIGLLAMLVFLVARLLTGRKP